MKRWLLGLGVLAVAGALGALSWSRWSAEGSDPAPVATSTASPAWRAVSWPPRGAPYAFEWNAKDERPVSGADLGGSLALSGTFALQRAPGGYLLRIEELDTAQLSLLDAQVPTEALVGTTAWVQLSPDGALREVRLPPDAAPLPQHLLWTLAQQLVLTTPPRGRLDTGHGLLRVQHTHQGTARVRTGQRYERVVGVGSLQGLDQEVDAAARFGMDAAGELSEASVREHLALTRDGALELRLQSDLELKRLQGEVDLQPGLDRTDWPVRDEQASLARAARNALEQRASGMPGDRLIGDLLDGDPSTDLSRWLFHAQGRLLLEPAVATRLGEALARKPELSLTRRRVGADLLARTNTAEAQAALRDSLSAWKSAMPEPEWSELVQRLGFVDDPDAQSVALLRSWLATASGDLHAALLFTLGATARHQRAAGVSSDDVVADLDDALAEASSPAERAVVLRAMGNAGLPALAGHAHSAAKSSAAVERAAAATALRSQPDTQSLDTLLALVGDEHIGVQQAALDAMRGRLDGPGVLEQLAGAVRGSPQRGNDGLIVTMLQPFAEHHAAQGLLRHILARSGDRPKLRARVRALLSP